jgi:hypothetical protein
MICSPQEENILVGYSIPLVSDLFLKYLIINQCLCYVVYSIICVVYFNTPSDL